MKRIDLITSFLRAGLLATVVLVAPSVRAQSTMFTYQGKLTEAGNPATGTYDIQFRLFDTPLLGTGLQQGSTLTNPTVQVAAGSFTVQLDFGPNVFSGAARYLEIAVRPAGDPNPHTILSPRQPITSSPYTIQTLNSTQLGGLPANRYVVTDSAGNVGIGTASPASKLDVRGNLTLDPGGDPILYSAASGGELNRYLQLINSPTTPNASGLKAGGILVADSFGFANPGKNDLIVKGNVGIGTSTLTSKVEIAAQDGLAITGVNPFMTLRDTANGNRRSFIQGADGHLVFIPHSFAGGGAAMVVRSETGNVGIGTSNPTAKLQVAAGNLPGISVTSQSNAVIGLSSTSGFAAIYGENTSGSSGFGVYGKGTTGYAMFADGNAGQSRDRGGIVKAMLYVNGDGTILRCYNALTGSSTGNCGFSVTRSVGTSAGRYDIDFGFQIDDRFFSVTANSNSNFAGANFFLFGSSLMEVRIGESNSGIFTDRPFMVIVY